MIYVESLYLRSMEQFKDPLFPILNFYLIFYDIAIKNVTLNYFYIIIFGYASIPINLNFSI